MDYLSLQSDASLLAVPFPNTEDSFTTKLFNRGLACCLMILALPILGVLWCVYFITDREGGPFLYHGVRLGKHKREFTIWKVRTLVVTAECQLGDSLYRNEVDLHTPYGDFLRRTRLDEIPQIWNILCGDMNFVGPRPLRPKIYRALAMEIPDYDIRFSVRPGLTGISQFFTPHGTSKRMRARLDNRFIRANCGWAGTLKIMYLTFAKMFGNLMREFAGCCRLFIMDRVLKRVPGEELWKATPRYGEWDKRGSGVLTTLGGELIDVGDDELLLRTTRKLPESGVFEIRGAHPRHRRRQVRVRCEGEILDTGIDPVSGDRLVSYRYRTRGDLDLYRLEKYVLKKSMG